MMKLKELSTKLINFYQKFISAPLHAFSKSFGFYQNTGCVFYPSCSEYTKQAVKKYGLLKGLYLGFGRILRCNPWQKNHLDPLK